MHYSDFILLTSGLINLVLSFFVFWRNRESKVNLLFSITVFSIFAWCLSIYFFRNSNVENIYAWGQFAYFANSFITVFFLYFSFVFPLGSFPKNKVVRLILFTIPLIAFVTSLVPRAIIIEAYRDGYDIYTKLGWGYYVHSLITFSCFSWAYFNIIQKLKGSTGTKRAQIIYLLLGTVVSTLIAIFTNVFLFFYTTKYNWIGPSGTVIMVVFITYAITRYRLMDIRAVMVRTLTFSFIVALLAGIYAVFSLLFAKILGELFGISSNILTGIILSILIVLGYQPIRKLVERTTARFLFKRSYNPDALLARIAEVTSSIVNIQTLLESISNTLNDSFRFQKIAIVLLDKNNKLSIAYQQGFTKEVAESLANYPDVLDILSQEITQTPGIMVLDEMKTRYENGEFKPVSPELLISLTENDLAIIAPLYVNQQLIGVMTLGNKKSGDSYTQQDIRIIKIISGQVAVAIENAKLYDELKNFNVILEEEVAEKTTELQSANEELRQLDKAKSEFISIASHQLRTPLTVIKGYISMMREGSFGKVPPKIMQNLEKVYASNERLIGLVENLLDISRIESGRQEYSWKEIHLEDLAQTVVDNLKQNAKARDLKLIFHKPKKKTPLVTADANKIHEVMMNFVDNAIKYTEKGKIEVSVDPSPKGMVTFCVKDTGRGISDESKNLLFKKFSRGKGSFQVHTEGVGLGLYVAKMLIDAHQGKIWADSKGVNKGSIFCFSLPLDVKNKK